MQWCLVVAAYKVVMVTFLVRLRLLQFDQAPCTYPSIVEGLDIVFVRYLWDNKLFSLLCWHIFVLLGVTELRDGVVKPRPISYMERGKLSS